jgi:atypical dual specificity phosphatase
LRSHGLAELAEAPETPILALATERQRAVNILSHALTRPPMLFVDEPTYGLKEAAAAWLVEWLAELGRGTRMVVVLHHQGQARKLADRVTLFGGGRVLACEPVERFFTGKVNARVEQFVRSGSLSIASPDAAPEDLGPDVTAPAPLLPAALAAVAPFKQPAAKPEPAAVVPRAPVATSAPAPAAAAPAAAAPAGAPRAPAALPSLSRHGVEDASMVGKVMLSAYRGPQGFSWIVPGKLAGCAEPGISSPLDYDLDLLARMGITHLITLTEKDLDDAALARHGLHNVHLSIFDREAPSLAQTYMLIRKMQALMDQGHIIAVHCKAGIGRTGTILAAWMIREGGVGAAAAIERLRKINPAYVQSEVQEKFLHEFEEDILRRM